MRIIIWPDAAKPYDPTKAYRAGDLVRYEHMDFVCTNTHKRGSFPNLHPHPALWTQVFRG